MKKLLNRFKSKVMVLPTGLFFVWVITSILITLVYFSSFNQGMTKLASRDAVPKHFVANNAEIMPEKNLVAAPEQGKVLGTNISSVDFMSASGSRMNGGIIVISSRGDSVVGLNSYKFDQEVKFELYKLDKNDLKNYLVYSYKDQTNDYGYIKKKYQVDKSQLEQVTSFSQQITDSSGSNNLNNLNLPLDNEGIWYLEGNHSSGKIQVVIVRAALAGIANKADGEITFWVQDADQKSVTDAEITLINTENNVAELNKLKTDEQGLAKSSASDVADIALISKGNSFTIIPLNLTNFNSRYSSSSSWGYSSFGPHNVGTRFFSFTDRVIYKPKDKVYYKAIIRKDDDADYSLATGQISVVLKGNNKVVYEKNQVIDDFGSVDGEIDLSDEIEVGYYSLYFYRGETHLGSTSFQVAEFHKPDSVISIDVDKHSYYPGDKFVSTISGSLFLGQPLSNQEVKYKVHEDYGQVGGSYEDVKFNTSLGYFGGYEERAKMLYEGSVTLDKNGQADLELDVINTTGERKKWLVILEYVDAGGAATIDGIQVLVNPGDFVIQYDYSSAETYVKDEEAIVPFRLFPTKSGAKIDGIKVSLNYGYSVSNISDEGPNYVMQQIGGSHDLISDSEGKLSFNFAPDKLQGYMFKLEARDKHKNYILEENTIYVRDDVSVGGPVPSGQLSLKLDKESYFPGETAVVTIDSDFDLEDMFMYVGRDYSREYRVLKNGQKEFKLEIPENYQPNVSLSVGSFFKNEWISGRENIEVETDNKKVNVSFSFNQDTYGPGQTAEIEIVAKDELGDPVETDMAVWVFDKALLELNKESYSQIFSSFWGQRYGSPTLFTSFMGLSGGGAEGGGGCFDGETKILMSDSIEKRIDQVKKGDYVKTLKSSSSSDLVSAKVLDVHKVVVDGYLIVNQDFKVTPEHKLFINGEWQLAADLKRGDKLLSSKGEEKTVNSIEWVRGRFEVYNLTIEKYHTFIAHDFYVHNDKGDSRSIFKDTAYWNPHIQTDSSGRAKVSIELPDNLTTWVIAGVSANETTQVGDGESEFIVTKEFVARPILPSFMRQGDQITLSSLVHNFTSSKMRVKVEAKLDVADLEDPKREFSLAGKEVKVLSWKTNIQEKNVDATFVVKAEAKGDEKYIDEVIQTIPVYEYGFLQDSYLSKVNDQSYSLESSIGADKERTKYSVILQTSRYPGFEEDLNKISKKEYVYLSGIDQILTIVGVANKYGADLDIKYDKKQFNNLVKEGLVKLTESLKNSNNSSRWSKSETDDSMRLGNLDILEALVFAQEAGIKINQQEINQAAKSFETWNPLGLEGRVAKQYAFSLVPDLDLPREELAMGSIKDGALISKAVLANYRNGFIDSRTGIVEIMKISHENDYQLSWKSTDTKSYQEVFDSTLSSVLALEELEADFVTIEKTLDYLYRNRGQQADHLLTRAIAQYYGEYADLSLVANYQVKLDDKNLLEGALKATDFKVVTVELDSEKVAENSRVAITNTGKATLYSKLLKTEFITDKELDTEGNHFELSRKYLSAEKTNKPVKVGDLIVVELSVNNLGLGERNLEIIDYLPSGLVAIDQSLDNGTFDSVVTDSICKLTIADQRVTLKINCAINDESVFRYKTRVISEGVFDTPPAIIRHLEEPTLWARSESTRLLIDGKNKLEMLHTDNQPVELKHTSIIYLIATLIIVGLVAFGVKNRKNNKELISKFKKLFKKKDEVSSNDEEQPQI